MKKIDFKHFNLFTDISHKDVEEKDARYDFSDALYKNLNGIMAHDVALRIYHSEGPVEFNDEEIELIRSFSTNATPVFQDSLIANIVE